MCVCACVCLCAVAYLRSSCAIINLCINLIRMGKLFIFLYWRSITARLSAVDNQENLLSVSTDKAHAGFRAQVAPTSPSSTSPEAQSGGRGRVNHGPRWWRWYPEELAGRRERCLLFSHVLRTEIAESHDDFARHVNACMLAVMRFHCENTSALWW